MPLEVIRGAFLCQSCEGTLHGRLGGSRWMVRAAAKHFALRKDSARARTIPRLPRGLSLVKGNRDTERITGFSAIALN